MHTDIKEAGSGSNKQFHFGLTFVCNDMEVLHTVLILHEYFLDEWLPQVPAREME